MTSSASGDVSSKDRAFQTLTVFSCMLLYVPKKEAERLSRICRLFKVAIDMHTQLFDWIEESKTLLPLQIKWPSTRVTTLKLYLIAYRDPDRLHIIWCKSESIQQRTLCILADKL